MESEKVREIKKALEHCVSLKNRCRDCHYGEIGCYKLLKDILTLINELESENERLSNTEIGELIKESEELAKQCVEWSELDFKKRNKINELKDRVAGLEKERAELKCSLTKKTMEFELLKCGKEIGNGIVEVLSEAQKSEIKYEVLKQFTERLKEKKVHIVADEDDRVEIRGLGIFVPDIDETLKEFVGIMDRQIEEMAEIIKDNAWKDIKEIEAIVCATEPYNQNYRKIDKDSVVLTKKEYEVLKIKEKEKQIREIARVTCKLKCKYCENCYHLRRAEALYNAKCRILTEDSVVLTKQEYENLKSYIGQADGYINGLEYELERTRKEMVKELLTAQFKEYKECEKLVLEARNSNKNDDYYKGFSLATTNQRMYLKELAKQYGVEIK